MAQLTVLTVVKSILFKCDRHVTGGNVALCVKAGGAFSRLNLLICPIEPVKGVEHWCVKNNAGSVKKYSMYSTPTSFCGHGS